MAMFLQVSFHSISIHAVLFMFLSFYVLPAYQIYFNFPNFADNVRNATSGCLYDESYVCLYGDASASGDGGINLTYGMGNSVGRAVYSKPVRIWNNSTGRMANFTTEFTFLITKVSNYTPGDGIAFFLSTYPTFISIDQTGGWLGLVKNISTEGKNFVAVEFDTYSNSLWDPPSSHVGIDVESIVSKSNISSNFSERVVKATVEYNADTLYLSVSIFSQGDPLLNGSILLSHPVNISDILPEMVTVGLTAATGTAVEEHRILSWAFTSAPLDDIKVPNEKNNNNTKRRLVVVGTTVGVGLLVTSICVILGFLFFRKKSRDVREGEGDDDDDEMGCINDQLENRRGPNPRKFST